MRWIALLCLAACGGASDAILLPHWTLDSGEAVTLPAHFPLPPRPLTYSLRTEVELPPAFRGQTLTLAIPYFTGRTRLFLDDREIPALESVSVDDYRTAAVHRFHLAAELTGRERLRLTMRIEHEWAQSAWFDSVPRLSATPAGDRWTRFVLAF